MVPVCCTGGGASLESNDTIGVPGKLFGILVATSPSRFVLRASPRSPVRMDKRIAYVAELPTGFHSFACLQLNRENLARCNYR